MPDRSDSWTTPTEALRIISEPEHSTLDSPMFDQQQQQQQQAEGVERSC